MELYFGYQHLFLERSTDYKADNIAMMIAHQLKVKGDFNTKMGRDGISRIP